MVEPTVSVVMAVRNVDRFLAESIESILAQSFRDFEFIIVDFGSRDDSQKIAARYAAKDSRICLCDLPQGNLNDARNRGCHMARGRYLAIMDADDVALPYRLSRELEFAEAHPEVGLLGGAIERIDADGNSLGIVSFPLDNASIQSRMNDQCAFCQSTVLMRKEAFLAAGGYRAAFTQAEDYDLWLRIAEFSTLANLAEVMVQYRIHANQLSTRGHREQTLCKLAAQASAAARRKGMADPLDGIAGITPAVLAGAGVSQMALNSDVISSVRWWISVLCDAREYDAAIAVALQTLRSDLTGVDTREVVDLYLVASRHALTQRRFLLSMGAALRASIIRPAVVGQLVKRIWRRLTLSNKSVLNGS